MSFALNTGRVIGSAAATVIHGTRLGTSNLALGAKQGYTSKAAEFAAKRAALGLSNTTPVEVVDTPKASKAKAPVGRRTARA